MRHSNQRNVSAEIQTHIGTGRRQTSISRMVTRQQMRIRQFRLAQMVRIPLSQTRPTRSRRHRRAPVPIRKRQMLHHETILRKRHAIVVQNRRQRTSDMLLVDRSIDRRIRVGQDHIQRRQIDRKLPDDGRPVRRQSEHHAVGQRLRRTRNRSAGRKEQWTIDVRRRAGQKDLSSIVICTTRDGQQSKTNICHSKTTIDHRHEEMEIEILSRLTVKQPETNRYAKRMQLIIDRVDISHVQPMPDLQSFASVLDHLVDNDKSLNWGRIVTMYAYAASHVRNEQDVDAYGREITIRVREWIDANGGWEAFMRWPSRKRNKWLPTCMQQ